MKPSDSLRFGEKLAREESRFASTGKGEFAPDHGGARYRIKTSKGTIELFDSQLKLNKRGLPRGMKNFHKLQEKMRFGGRLSTFMGDSIKFF